MDDVQCNEDDEKISNCAAKLIMHICGHDKDIWLLCRGKFTKKAKTKRMRLHLPFQNIFSNTSKFSNGQTDPQKDFTILISMVFCQKRSNLKNNRTITTDINKRLYWRGGVVNLF